MIGTGALLRELAIAYAAYETSATAE
jgi:hypothetical protein